MSWYGPLKACNRVSHRYIATRIKPGGRTRFSQRATTC